MVVKSDLVCMGRVDGMGIPHSDGSYVSLVWSGEKTGNRHEIIISEGRADTLISQIEGALREKIGRDRGPVEILCREIGYPFERALEVPVVVVSFVAVLVSHISDLRMMQAQLSDVTGKRPSDDSLEVLRRTEELLLLDGTENQLIDGAAEVHSFIHEVAPDDAYPCDHLIDMLSSCVSAIRFGLETPCHSRHAAEAASHVWKHLYGVSRFDRFTPNWEKDWARAQLQTALLRLALTRSKGSGAR